MATSASMTDLLWVVKLARAKLTVRYTFQSIHVCAQLRGTDGIAPVVLCTTEGYIRAPIALEAAFEVILRHLHHSDTKWPVDRSMTASALLTDRSTAALLLPGRYIPTLTGEVLDMLQLDNLPVDPVERVEILPACDITQVEVEVASFDRVEWSDDGESRYTNPPSARLDTPTSQILSHVVDPPLSVPVSAVVHHCAGQPRPSTKKERRRSAQQARRRGC
jgi:hypothetical protein